MDEMNLLKSFIIALVLIAGSIAGMYVVHLLESNTLTPFWTATVWSVVGVLVVWAAVWGLMYHGPSESADH